MKYLIIIFILFTSAAYQCYTEDQDSQIKKHNLDLGLAINTANGTTLKSAYKNDNAIMRFSLTWPFKLNDKGFSYKLPFAAFASTLLYKSAPVLSFGTIEPVGLVNYAFNTSASLMDKVSLPLILNTATTAKYLGLALGTAIGTDKKSCNYVSAFTFMPMQDKQADTSRLNTGLYISNIADFLSAMLMLTTNPSGAHNSRWYTRPEPEAQRLFASIMLSHKWKNIGFAAAIASSSAFPGLDGISCKAEIQAKFWKLFFNIDSQIASPAWASPIGKNTDFAKLNTKLNYDYSGVQASFACSLLWEDTEPRPSKIIVRAEASLYDDKGLAKLLVNITPQLKNTPPSFELASKLRPNFLHWFTFLTSWKVDNYKTSRFDLECNINFKAIVDISINGGVRFEPDSLKFRAGVLVEYKAKEYSLGGGLGTQSWISKDAWYKNLEYSIYSTYKYR